MHKWRERAAARLLAGADLVRQNVGATAELEDNMEHLMRDITSARAAWWLATRRLLVARSHGYTVDDAPPFPPRGAKRKQPEVGREQPRMPEYLAEMRARVEE